jgi:hypothetical protein
MFFRVHFALGNGFELPFRRVMGSIRNCAGHQTGPASAKVAKQTQFGKTGLSACRPT